MVSGCVALRITWSLSVTITARVRLPQVTSMTRPPSRASPMRRLTGADSGLTQRDHAVCRHHVAEAYIDEFHFCFLFIYSIPKPATGYSMF